MPSKTTTLTLLGIGMGCGAALGIATDRNSDRILEGAAQAKDPVVALLDHMANRSAVPTSHVIVRVERGIDTRGFAIVDVVVPVADKAQCDIAVGEGIRSGASVASGGRSADPCDRAFPSEVRLRQTPGTDL